MSENEAIELVTAVICKISKTDRCDVPPDADLPDTLGLNSLDAAEILAALHNETGLELKIESGDELRSVAGIARRLVLSAVR